MNFLVNSIFVVLIDEVHEKRKKRVNILEQDVLIQALTNISHPKSRYKKNQSTSCMMGPETFSFSLNVLNALDMYCDCLVIWTKFNKVRLKCKLFDDTIKKLQQEQKSNGLYSNIAMHGKFLVTKFFGLNEKSKEDWQV